MKEKKEDRNSLSYKLEFLKKTKEGYYGKIDEDSIKYSRMVIKYEPVDDEDDYCYSIS